MSHYTFSLRSDDDEIYDPKTDLTRNSPTFDRAVAPPSPIFGTYSRTMVDYSLETTAPPDSPQAVSAESPPTEHEGRSLAKPISELNLDRAEWLAASLTCAADRVWSTKKVQSIYFSYKTMPQNVRDSFYAPGTRLRKFYSKVFCTLMALEEQVPGFDRRELWLLLWCFYNAPTGQMLLDVPEHCATLTRQEEIFREEIYGHAYDREQRREACESALLLLNLFMEVRAEHGGYTWPKLTEVSKETRDIIEVVYARCSVMASFDSQDWLDWVDVIIAHGLDSVD